VCTCTCVCAFVSGVHVYLCVCICKRCARVLVCVCVCVCVCVHLYVLCTCTCVCLCVSMYLRSSSSRLIPPRDRIVSFSPSCPAPPPVLQLLTECCTLSRNWVVWQCRTPPFKTKRSAVQQGTCTDSGRGRAALQAWSVVCVLKSRVSTSAHALKEEVEQLKPTQTTINCGAQVVLSTSGQGCVHTRASHPA